MKKVEGLYYMYICTCNYVAKTKAQINCMINVQLICAFVFAYSKSGFSYDAAHILLCLLNFLCQCQNFKIGQSNCMSDFEICSRDKKIEKVLPHLYLFLYIYALMDWWPGNWGIINSYQQFIMADLYSRKIMSRILRQ